MKKIPLLVFVSLMLSLGVAAQYVGDPANLNPGPLSQGSGLRADPEVFLQGTFIELGIAQGGSCGTIGAAPGGYHNIYRPPIGFIADFQLDGWAVGTPPFSGDYFLPGTPWEGWLLEFTTAPGGEYTFINCDATSNFDVPQTSLTNTSAGTMNSALWTGTATAAGQSVLVQQNFHFDDSEGKFSIDVTLTNSGPDPLLDLEYARAVDPDQEEDLTFNFTTRNFVSHEPDGSNNLAQVEAYGLAYNIPMALRITHPNAKAHVVPSGLQIYSPDEALDATFAPTEGAPYIQDVGVAVAIRFPVVNPGQSVSFTVVYALNEQDIQNPEEIPLSNWSLAILIGLIAIFTIVRFRRAN